jgi:hypothetical protein
MAAVPRKRIVLDEEGEAKRLPSIAEVLHLHTATATSTNLPTTSANSKKKSENENFPIIPKDIFF